MTTDYRALCAELLDALENAIGVIYGEDGTKHISTADAVITKADAALAQPEPEGPGPTNEELIQLAIDTRLYRFQATAGDPVQYEMTEQQVHAFARAVLARWGNS